MTIENQQKNNDLKERCMAEYSSPVFTRGLELAKKISVVTIIQDADTYNNKGLDLISVENYEDALKNWLSRLYGVNGVKCSDSGILSPSQIWIFT